MAKDLLILPKGEILQNLVTLEPSVFYVLASS